MANFNKAKCHKIKSMIEEMSGISYISSKINEGAYPDLRKIYIKLCRSFTTASFSEIGSVINRDHSSCINQLKACDNLISTNQLKCFDVYVNIKAVLESNKYILKKTSLSNDVDLRISHIKIIEKYRSIINKKNLEIENLKNELNKYRK